jgi:dipeptidyl aminopeptidase/acylaminoacyl peptidase
MNKSELPYGSWPSPITSDLAVSTSVGVGDILLDGEQIYWLEFRPAEGGRSVVVTLTAAGEPVDVTPPGFNVRSRVHEYGGGAYLVHGGDVFFSNDADGRLYRHPAGEAPLPLTGGERLRYADGIADRARRRLIWVREDHTAAASHPVNTLVAISLDDDGAQTVLADGADFYSSPCLSPDGSRLAWLQWCHPNMPWDGTELWVGRLAPDGSIGERHLVAGGVAESVFQPQWSPDGVLYFASDRTGWWNLYRVHGELQAIYPCPAECGHPQWVFRMSTYAFLSADRLVCCLSKQGLSTLALIDLRTGAATMLPTSFTDIGSLRAAGPQLYFRGGSPTRFPAIVRLEIATGTTAILKTSSSQSFDGFIATPQPIEFSAPDGLPAYGLLYLPQNANHSGPAGELPPLIVYCHGGPTGSVGSTIDWKTQFWTSRGYARLHVNYSGSSGYGRAYRQRLSGQWGIADVADCIAGAQHLAAQGLVDGARMGITGGSAGGYTVLCALTFHDVFATGSSYYGISDLEALAAHTHKFESSYLENLIGPYPARQDIYHARSPIHFAEKLAVPTAFYQGSEDRVVPPAQTEQMVAALKARGVPVQCVLFNGEQHGFRRAQNLKFALDTELAFNAIFLARTNLLVA